MSPKNIEIPIFDLSADQLSVDTTTKSKCAKNEKHRSSFRVVWSVQPKNVETNQLTYGVFSLPSEDNSISWCQTTRLVVCFDPDTLVKMKRRSSVKTIKCLVETGFIF